MLNFFESVVTWLSTIVSIILNIFTTIIELVHILLSMQSAIFPLISIMPAVISSCILIVISVCIVKFVIGR